MTGYSFPSGLSGHPYAIIIIIITEAPFCALITFEPVDVVCGGMNSVVIIKSS